MNFSLVLFLLMLFTGGVWFLNLFYLKPRRQRQAVDRDPIWLEYSAGLFPVVALVFVLRSFLFEPFKIPSGSMIPTLLVGDLILVNKFVYGIRLPVVNLKIINITEPQRGDVMVFRFPRDPSVDYIKRVVGIPGDTIRYESGRVILNGELLPLIDSGEFYDGERLTFSSRFTEHIGDVNHGVLVDVGKPGLIAPVADFSFRDQCAYTRLGVTCKVPAGNYFVMGDNRDNSLDSRYWGFVPEQNIVGKAFFVWMNFSDLSRIGRFN